MNDEFTKYINTFNTLAFVLVFWYVLYINWRSGCHGLVIYSFLPMMVSKNSDVTAGHQSVTRFVTGIMKLNES